MIWALTHYYFLRFIWKNSLSSFLHDGPQCVTSNGRPPSELAGHLLLQSILYVNPKSAWWEGVPMDQQGPEITDHVNCSVIMCCHRSNNIPLSNSFIKSTNWGRLGKCLTLQWEVNSVFSCSVGHHRLPNQLHCSRNTFLHWVVCGSGKHC